MNIKISEIEVSLTYPLRHELLRKGKPLKSCYLEGDKNLETIHIGAYTSKELIGIASAYLNSCPQYFDKKGVQLRAIAVIPRFQRQGIATKLINHILKKVKIKINPDYIWLNSRISANQLYLSNGFNPIDKPFNIKSIGMHQRFIIIIN